MAPWIPCACGNYWCTVHGKHAHECDCPPIEGWTTDPYRDDAPRARRGPAPSGVPPCRVRVYTGRRRG
jgi:hypothetical protein